MGRRRRRNDVEGERRKEERSWKIPRKKREREREREREETSGTAKAGGGEEGKASLSSTFASRLLTCIGGGGGL